VLEGVEIEQGSCSRQQTAKITNYEETRKKPHAGVLLSIRHKRVDCGAHQNSIKLPTIWFESKLMTNASLTCSWWVCARRLVQGRDETVDVDRGQEFDTFLVQRHVPGVGKLRQVHIRVVLQQATQNVVLARLSLCALRKRSMQSVWKTSVFSSSHCEPTVQSELKIASVTKQQTTNSIKNKTLQGDAY